MPPVIVGVAAGVAAAGVVSTAAAIAIGVAATALTYAVTPEFGAGSFSNEAYAQQQMLRSPAEPRRGVYGRAMVSGPLIFAEETGTDNEFLHLHLLAIAVTRLKLCILAMKLLGLLVVVLTVSLLATRELNRI